MMLSDKKPSSVGEILREEFLSPLGLTQAALSLSMGISRRQAHDLCHDRRRVDAATALILARVFNTSAEFWLNVQRRSDLWKTLNNPKDRARIDRARPVPPAA